MLDAAVATIREHETAKRDGSHTSIGICHCHQDNQTSHLPQLGHLTRGNLIPVVYLRVCRFGLPPSLLALSQAPKLFPVTSTVRRCTVLYCDLAVDSGICSRNSGIYVRHAVQRRCS